MATLESCETIYERVDTLIRSQGGSWPPVHSTTTHHAIAELIARDQCLEEAIREIAMALERLAIEHERLKLHH